MTLHKRGCDAGRERRQGDQRSAQAAPDWTDEDEQSRKVREHPRGEQERSGEEHQDPVDDRACRLAAEAVRVLVLLCYKHCCLLGLPARQTCRLIWEETWVSSERTFRRLRTFIS